MKTLFLFPIWITLTFAFPSNAQDIGVKLSEIAPGSYLTYEGGDGSVSTLVIGRESRGSRQVKVVDGADPNGKVSYTQLWNSKGESVGTQGLGGSGSKNDFRYTPHDCSRTIGICDYVSDNGVGSVVKWRRETTVKANRVFYTLRPIQNGKALRVHKKGSFEIDDFGIIRRSTLQVSGLPSYQRNLVGGKIRSK